MYTEREEKGEYHLLVKELTLHEKNILKNSLE